MGTKHLTEADRLRARTLFFDAGLPKARICHITGFSLNQVKLAIREKTPKTRSGRPPRRRSGAAVAMVGAGRPGLPGLCGLPGPALQGAHGCVAAGEHGEDSAVRLAHAAAAAGSAAHCPSDRIPPRLLHEQPPPPLPHGRHRGGPLPIKWEPGYSPSPQPPYYTSWPPSALKPLSPGPDATAGGPRGLATPVSPLLLPPPPPTTTTTTTMAMTTSNRVLAACVGPLSIPSPPASSSAASVKGCDEAGSLGSSSGGGRRSDDHDVASPAFSSSLASSLASSATSCSSMSSSSSSSLSSSSSSSSSGGGFSLLSILASANGP